ncbi:hypothetical protein [Nocardioides sp. GXZ039]|uniref:hypothetical protein n=1 Tax=Nocardioides sp. GXZ039 TaxID=3136018 RepID=UPI0030F3771E
MNDTSQLLDYELRRNHHSQATPLDDQDRARADLLTARRQSRRHRMAGRMRALADRIDS